MSDLDTQTNINIGRTLASALSTNDVTRLDAILDPDVVWHFPGSGHTLAGDHTGFAGLTAFSSAVHRLTAGTFRMAVHDVYGSERGAVIAFTGHGRRADGRELHNPTRLVLRTEHGRVREMWEFCWDSAAVTAFWR